jgi:hypothetical protein
MAGTGCEAAVGIVEDCPHQAAALRTGGAYHRGKQDPKQRANLP